ncbi:MAG TPA: hypothetical protein DCS82_01305 [Rhodospirillaceae bacterium]|nr:hypothetical protein [Rhodospirillaceae bacterium]HAA91266.1 hypothetical protein [Rhodospirillaceae bacterium]HAT34327.1 hypothetical protein [Rhodospirillaceae bacterium]|tara:strand:+ start:162 stop:863 length:702 start_codon:yes stop_codon:yes gene_type:complete
MKLLSTFILSAFITATLGSTAFGGEVGKGPITLSNKVKRYLERYLDEGEPGAFAITADGKYALYMFCPGAFCSDEAYIKQDTVDNCETKAEKRGITAPCRILAVGDEIVWDGPVKNLPRSLREDTGNEPEIAADTPQDSSSDNTIEKAENTFEAIEIGSKVTSPVSLGSIRVPLPGSNWVVIAKKKSLYEKNDGDVLNVSLILAQIQNDTLKKVVSMTTVGARTNPFKGLKKT